MAKYRNPFSVDQRKPIVIDIRDPRSQGNNLRKFIGKAGSEVITTQIPEKKSLGKKIQNYWSSTLGIAGMTANVIDAVENTYCVGVSASGSGTTTKMVFLKYDKTGRILLQKEFSGGRAAKLIFDDTQSYLYVSGFIYNGTTWDTLLIKIDLSGNIIWQKRISNAWSTGSNFWTSPWYTPIALDGSGNVHIGTNINGGVPHILKYDSDGTLLSQIKFNNDAYINVIKFDSDGNKYVFNSSLHGTTFINTGMHIYKYNSSDTLVWDVGYKQAGEVFTGWRIQPVVASIDNDGEVYIGAMIAVRAAGAQDMALIKLSKTDGSITWHKYIPYDPIAVQGYFNNQTEISFDSSNNVYWCWNWENFNNYAVIIRYEPDGTETYQRMFSRSGGSGSWIFRGFKVYRSAWVGAGFIDGKGWTVRLPIDGSLMQTITQYTGLTITYEASSFVPTAKSYSSQSYTNTTSSGVATEFSTSLTNSDTALSPTTVFFVGGTV